MKKEFQFHTVRLIRYATTSYYQDIADFNSTQSD